MRSAVRLYSECGRFNRWISADQANTLLVSGSVGAFYDPETNRYLGVKVWRAEDETSPSPSSGQPSPTGLTSSDMFRNAAGVVDTGKRSELRRLHRENDVVIPADVRRYGLNEKKKPDPMIVGNSVDESMTRVEQWGAASATNAKTVTVSCTGIVNATYMEPSKLAALGTSRFQT